MQNGRGIAFLRSTAGVVTAIGLVLLLFALLVVPAVPVLAATPTLDITTFCDGGDDHMLTWTAMSSNQTPDGGTADGAVTVTEVVTFQGVTTETVIVGEFNDGNGYTMTNTFEALAHEFIPGFPPSFVQIIVEVDQFNDGTGVNSVVMSSVMQIDQCKEGTTTTGATTTTIPATITATVTALCLVQGDVVTHPITVTVTGDEGATGVVTINGVDFPYTIDDSGEAVIAVNGIAGDNTIDVVDDNFGTILSEIINIDDCGDGTTTTTVDDTTTTVDDTTTTTVDDTTTTTVDDTTTTTVDDTTTTTVDDTTTTTVDDTTTTTGGDTTTTTGGDGSTTTTDSSSTDGTPPVSVLPTELDQTELPQTGIDNGPLAAIGVGMLIGGAGLLMAARRQENMA